MADGILCKHCGWQETDHEYADELTDAKKKIRGYKKTLLKCRGFVGEEPPIENTPEEVASFIEHAEIQARGRYAWGVFLACGRLQEVRSTLAKHNRAIKGAFTGEEKDSAIAAKEKYIHDCRWANGFHIG